MNNFAKNRWTVWGVLIILHGFLIGGVVADELENVQNEQEVKSVSAVEKANVEFDGTELFGLRFLTSQLVFNKSDNLSAVLQTAFNYIKKQRFVIGQSYNSILQAEKFVKSCRMDAEDKKELLDRLESAKFQIERNVSIPSLVARRGGLRTSTCSVLAVNKSLDAVILDVGYINGISPGSKWITQSSNGKTIMLQVAEVRRTVSAAVPVAGRVDSVAVGQVAEKAKENTLESKENYGN